MVPRNNNIPASMYIHLLKIPKNRGTAAAVECLFYVALGTRQAVLRLISANHSHP